MKVLNINDRPNQFIIELNDINWWKGRSLIIDENNFFSDKTEYKRVQQFYITSIFQSYKSMIAIKGYEMRPFNPDIDKDLNLNDIYCLRDDYDEWVVHYNKPLVILDNLRWDYSTTTGKYRNIFLNEKKDLTQKRINSNLYLLANLNIN
tara:strand:+ start:486 stop:932 length:447 start_codon:yes stop_codon:yes gene_type:complete